MANILITEITSSKIETGKYKFWWLGQQGWCVKTAEQTLYFDPYLSEREKRNIPPVCTPEELDNADFILCTHDHIDHLDRPALPGIMKVSKNARLIAPSAAISANEIEGVDKSRITSIDAEDSIDIDGLSVTAIKAQHEYFDKTEAGYPYLQYIVKSGGITIYHAGDTLLYNGMIDRLQEFTIDIAFVPINGRDGIRYRRGCMGNMTWQEAADLCGEIKPKLVCPGHWEMFSDNSENPWLFADYCRAKYPEQKFWIQGLSKPE